MGTYDAKIESILSFILIAAAFILLLPGNFYSPIFSGLDGSWQVALNLAWERKFVFGKEFLFTYGPLGIISPRYAFPGAFLPMLLSDLLLIGSISFLLYKIWDESRSVVIGLMALGISIGMPQYIFGVELSISYMVITMCFVFHYLKTKQFIYLALASLTSVLSFYIKLNSGLVCGILLIGTVIYLLVFRKISIKLALGSCFSFLILLLLGSLILSVDLLTYIRGGVEIAAGYNEAMVLNTKEFPQVLVMAVIFFSMFIGYSLYRLLSLIKDPVSLLHFGWIAATSFVVFKQGYVRADGHVLAFPQWIGVIFGLGSWYLSAKNYHGLKILSVIALIISISISDDKISESLLPNRISAIASYASDVSLSKEEAQSLYLKKQPGILPQEIIKKISGSKVDIFPWDIFHIFSENLNYHPRPVMQSYSAYTPYLDQLNASAFSSSSGPEFIIFRSGAIDERYPWFDESLTKQTIARNFRVVEQKNEWLLLQRLSRELERSRGPAGEERRAFGEWIKLPESLDLVYGRFAIKYTLLGSLSKFFYQVTPPRVTLRLEDGKEFSFRAVVPAIKSDVLVSHFVNTSDEAKLFFDRDFAKLKKVTHIRISTSESWAFKPRFTVNYAKINF